MKKSFLLFFAFIMAWSAAAFADVHGTMLSNGAFIADQPGVSDEAPIDISLPSGIKLKQGFVIPWDNPSSGFMNMTTTTILQTREFQGWHNWNALWEGWSLDAAWAYDANTSSVGLMLGRHLGTLGKYLPIDYPLADKVDITLYPVGMIVSSPLDEPKVSGASGAAIIKLSVEF